MKTSPLLIAALLATTIATCIAADSVVIVGFRDDKCRQEQHPNSAWMNATVGQCTAYPAFSAGLVAGSCNASSTSVKMLLYSQWSCTHYSSKMQLPLAQCIRSPFPQLQGYIIAYCSTKPAMCAYDQYCPGGVKNMCCFGNDYRACCNFVTDTCGQSHTAEGTQGYCAPRN